MSDKVHESMLSVRNIFKAFTANIVLKGIDLDLQAGEVLALIGGNGAGKSTLMKILMGIYQPDAGEIYIAGNQVKLSKPSISLSQGIYLVPQEPMLFPNMTVEDNVIMGFKENPKQLRKRLLELMEQLDWRIDLSRKAESLSIAEQQLVELLRGLMRNSRILILDEPTSSLTFNEVKSLFRIVEDLKKKGISIIYITHRLSEVFMIATDVAIMRDGVITLNGPVEQFTEDMLVKGLLPENAKSKKLKQKAEAIDYSNAEPVLTVDKLCGHGFCDVSFSVFPGEILGLAGVVGAGRTELATTIIGRDEVLSGNVFINGRNITGQSTRKVMDNGISYVPEDRFLNGIFKISDVAANSSASNLNNMGHLFMNFNQERELTDHYVNAFRTKVTGRSQEMGSLSGGNQQKVVIGRALAIKPKLLILDEPTRGIDAAARGDVYDIIQGLKAKGLAILLISSDMEEIIELSDRAMSMYCGRINKKFSKNEITQDSLMTAAFGVAEEASNA
ncbi:MAG: sugar ABC transporter ATP-binding protein [Spirochaetales bacterium]|nr:sugar ABC transporter ATP-binding protein [Spirochaetales bacterium]